MDGMFVIQRPKSRGRFSRERHLWNQIHQDRFSRWLDGDTIGNIAQVYGVSQRAIHHSIEGVLARLHRDDRIRALQYRHDNRFGFDWRVQDAALIEYRALMNPTWLFAQIRRMIQRATRTRRSRKR